MGKGGGGATLGYSLFPAPVPAGISGMQAVEWVEEQKDARNRILSSVPSGAEGGGCGIYLQPLLRTHLSQWEPLLGWRGEGGGG